VEEATTPAGATPFQRSLGLRWRGTDAGGVAVEMDVRDDLRGPAGSLEGGVVSTITDVAGASAAAMALGSMVATQQISISFLAPGRVGPIRATGTPVRVGRQDAVVRVEVVDVGHDDRLVAVALVTVKGLTTQPAGGPANG
jgi:uncharacterized protein (TIGR00369 family)